MIEIWTDGAVAGNPGPGGWAWLSDEEGSVNWKTDKVLNITTSCKMEMVAVAEALESAPKNSDVVLYCDSSYVVNGMRKQWYVRWGIMDEEEKDEYLTVGGTPVANVDLWRRIVRATERHNSVEWVKVKGHTKSNTRAAVGNRRVDKLASSRAQMAKKLTGFTDMDREKGERVE